MYKLTPNGMVLRLADGACIPPDLANTDYQRYLADVANGVEVLPADPEAEPEPSGAAQFGEMFGSIEAGGNQTSEEIAAVLIGLMGYLEAKGF
jgi:hypothetical protein